MILPQFCSYRRMLRDELKLYRDNDLRRMIVHLRLTCTRSRSLDIEASELAVYKNPIRACMTGLNKAHLLISYILFSPSF